MAYSVRDDPSGRVAIFAPHFDEKPAAQLFRFEVFQPDPARRSQVAARLLDAA
jgi:hypothetical protein